ncbi:phage tail tape measure protein [Stappia sp.]|uniref:phage tail tape measure protein n=1 Tax=Stappia sp. TaxID=1870903 RepID=UPI003C7DF0E1
MDLATLGLAVDSGPVTKARDELGRFVTASKKAEDAATGFGKRTEDAARRAAAANDNTARAAAKVAASYKALLPIAMRVAGVLGAIGGVAISADVRGARDLSASLAEVSTLLNDTGDDLARIQAAARDMGKEFGTTAASQVKGFYQAISAGATDVATATALLESANKVAIGGITDTVTAVDVLTTATNAYAASGLSAAEASDALFVGMRAGKTTIAELASSLGNVIPTAASLGVSFDELVAGTAALTTQGQSTAQAVTGVRAILTQIAKPTSEAAKLAKSLGLEFNTTSLQAKGLSGFLDDVIAKTGGNVDAMAQLFGSVEALNAVLSFAGGGGAAFAKILQDMADKAGAADAAYGKVADSLDKRLGVALNRIADVSVRLGEALLTVIVPATEAFATALETVADNAADLAIILAPIAAVHLVKMVAGFASLAAGMNLAAVAARALSVAMAFVGGPIGLALTGLAAGFVLLKNNVSDAAKAARDADSAYQANKSSIEAARQSSDGYTVSLRNQIAMQVEVAKTAYASADAAFYSALKMRDAFRAMTGMKLAPLEYMTDVRGDEADQLGALVAKLQSQLAEVDANIKKVETAAGGGGVAVSGLGGSSEKNPYDDLIRTSQQFIAAQNLERDALFMTEAAASELRIQQELLNQAANDNIDLTVMSADGERTRGQVLRDLAGDMAAAEAAAMDLAESYNFTKDAAKGVLSTFTQDLRNGELSLRSFGDAALSVFDKIVDKLNDQVATAFANAFAPRSSGGGGGLFGSILGGLLGGGGGGGFPSASFGNLYANGGAFDQTGEITAFAKGGVVDRATVFPFAKGIGLMGEAGPEAIMPLKRGPDGRLGVSGPAPAANSNGGGQSVVVNQTFQISGAVSSEEIKAAIRQQAEATKADIEGNFARTFERNRKAGTV